MVGVDGSESSTRAAVYAAGVARRRGLGLLVVHVTPRKGIDDALPMAGPEIRARFADSATALVESAADTVRQTTGLTDVGAEVIDDHPVDGLLALSAEAEVIVIGRRGVGGLPGMILGSTAGAVVQQSECPVIALPDEPDDAEPGRQPVVVGVEGRPGDDEVLAFAVAEAAARRTDLVALHAWQEVAMVAALGAYQPLVDWTAVEEQEQHVLTDAVARWRTEAPGVAIRETVARDRATAALLAASDAAELLVVGHRHRGRLARLGSTMNGVLHRASCPVAVVPLRD
ncbi:universal stress protein [Candidatus Blastococcus massiliensis]|uniref:universal stress protein n=1 Tax=Candidatus Blastococcus massiliensis TaxID=1470358 RepID=UPI0004AF14C1|nr:universal stress protein [Candidatus Blastococcus massiliensis]